MFASFELFWVGVWMFIKCSFLQHFYFSNVENQKFILHKDYCIVSSFRLLINASKWPRTLQPPDLHKLRHLLAEVVTITRGEFRYQWKHGIRKFWLVYTLYTSGQMVIENKIRKKGLSHFSGTPSAPWWPSLWKSLLYCHHCHHLLATKQLTAAQIIIITDTLKQAKCGGFVNHFWSASREFDTAMLNTLMTF